MWKESGKPIHILSTGKEHFPEYLYFDKLKKHPPYMGVTYRLKTVKLSDFSTSDTTYPQITVGYPQKTCLDRQGYQALYPICGHDSSTRGGYFSA